MLIDMHDYSPAARAYWWATVSAGAVVLALALAWALAAGPIPLFKITFGIAFAVLAGLFAARIPGAKTSVGAAELILFLLLLEIGPYAACLAAAAEAGAISWRTSKRWTSRLGSPAIAGLAMCACGLAFEHVRDDLPLAIGGGSESTYAALLAMVAVYSW
jgi:hypothetical protein